MRYVWEVTATGGDPVEITKGVDNGLDLLRNGRHGRDDIGGELLPWRTSIVALGIIDTVSEGERTSVLVEVETMDADEQHERSAGGAGLGAVLSTGFDEVILDEVLIKPGVRECSHSDRIKREPLSA